MAAYVPDRLLKAVMAKGTIARMGAVLVLVGLLVLGSVILTDVSILVAVGGWILAGLTAVLAVAAAGALLALLIPGRFAPVQG